MCVKKDTKDRKNSEDAAENNNKKQEIITKT